MATPKKQAVYNFLLICFSYTAVYIVMKLIVFEFTNTLSIPFWDEIVDSLRFYSDKNSFYGIIKYIFTKHNEHFLSTAKIIFLTDYYFWHGQGFLQVIMSNVIQLFSVFVTYKMLDLKNSNKIIKVSYFLCILLLFLNPNFIYDLIVPFNIEYFIVSFIMLLGGVLTSKLENGTCKWSHFLVILISLGIINALTMSNSPALFISITISAMVLKWDNVKIQILCWLTLAHIVCILYITHTGAGLAEINIIASAKYALLFLGGTFIRLTPWPAAFNSWVPMNLFGYIVGISIVFITAMFSVRRIRSMEFGGQAAIFGLVLAITVIVTAGAAGFSRAMAQGILDGANKKYAPISVLGIIGCFMMLIDILRPMISKKIQPENILIFFLFFVVVPLSIAGQKRELDIWGKFSQINKEASIACFLQADDKAFLTALYRPDENLNKFVTNIKNAHKGIFYAYKFQFGESLNDYTKNSTKCSGNGVIDYVVHVPTQERSTVFNAPGELFRMEGWSWIDDIHSPAKYIVVTDDSQHIVGLGLNTRRSNSAENYFARYFDTKLGWFGFIRISEPTQLHFWGVSDDSRYVCKLGEFSVDSAAFQKK